MDSSINPVDVVLSKAKVSQENLSTDQLCEILGKVMWEVKVGLKYLDDYKPLKDLLNSILISGHGEFVTADNDMPDFNNTEYTAKTKFLTLSMREENNVDPQSCEKKFSILLLVDEWHLAILNITCFWWKDHYVVCKSSFVADQVNRGLLKPDSDKIKDLISQKVIYVSSLVDRLFMCFHSTIKKREEYLRSMRQTCDLLQCVHGRFS